MNPGQDSRAALRLIASGLGLFVAVVGAVALIGWATGFDGWTTLFIGSVPTNPSTAVALVAAGTSLALLAPDRRHGGDRFARGLARALAAAVVALAALTIVEHALRRGVGTGDRLFRDIFAGIGGRGPMSLGSSVALLLIGAALLALDHEARDGRHPASALAVVAVLIPLQAIVAWAYGVAPRQGQSPLTEVSLQAGGGFALLCTGVILARPHRGIVRIVASPGPAGFTARRLLVAIVLLPVILGWLFVVGLSRAAHYEAMVGVSLVVVSAIATGAVVVWMTARQIQRTDEGRTVVEEALRAEREWFRTTLASIGDAVIATDDGGRVTDLNSMAESLTGVRASDALGQPIGAVFRVRDAARTVPADSPFERVLREARVADLPRGTVLFARGGGELPVEGCAAPIRDRRGQPRGVVLVFRDISERHRVEEERTSLLARERAARADAEAASRAKDEFIATLSHELRTPLNSVLGWARLLRTGKLDAAGLARAVEAIERGATTQALIVDDLLDVARIVRGQLRLDVRPVELVPVIEAAIDTIRPAAAARAIEIAAVLDPRAGPVSGDPGRLQQVAWNLLANAIKFTPTGGRVEVRLARLGDHVELSVQDNGAGIPPEFVPHVFERFRQADSSTTRAHGGLGLGLAIVRHLVEAHGGTASAESAGPNLGSTFRVSLPLQARPRPREVEPLRTPARAHPVARAPASLDALRVLIVDDDHDTLDVVKELLELAGADVMAAASADEALRVLAREPPDVLVSDIGMPGKDGYDLIRSVRALTPEQGGRVPAAALTAFTQSDHRQQALSAGYQLYLAKPIEPGELTSAVARLAGRA